MIQTRMKRIRAATRAARAKTPASTSKRRPSTSGRALQKDEYKDMVMAKNGASDSSDDEEGVRDYPFSKNVLVLTCFAPVGSPLIGTSYRIDKHGATLGRKPSNTVALCSVSCFTSRQYNFHCGLSHSWNFLRLLR